jgi:hypothetical protein
MGGYTTVSDVVIKTVKLTKRYSSWWGSQTVEAVKNLDSGGLSRRNFRLSGTERRRQNNYN